MALPSFTMKELIEAGVHFGHKTQRWDPRMSPYLFGVRNKIHIIDLEQTLPLLKVALKAINEISAKNGRVLFVGTKYQASPIVAEEAKRCGQYYVNHRWLGGMLTNWKTVSRSISTLKDYEEQLAHPESISSLKKKEILSIQRNADKLERSLGGIKEMGGLPDIIVVMDANIDRIAIKEAQKLDIPIVAILDSNSNPEFISYPIPGNDDATKAIRLYCRLMSEAILGGIQASLVSAGIDVGEMAEPPSEFEQAVAEVKTPKTEKKAVKKPAKKVAKKKEAKS